MEQKQTQGLYTLRAETEEEVLGKLRELPQFFQRYQSMDERWRKRFLDYCMGRKTLPVTYDPFFKRLFHPDIHPGRLSRFLSSLLEQNVRVVRILPSEETLLDGGALLVMDILVELEDGSLANIEVQKIPYLFPGERMSCYSSDLVLRQYSRVKGERGAYFKYSDMKKVYTIVLLETSPKEFHNTGMHYIHYGRTAFDTGLNLELLQEFCLIALDVFREVSYAKDRSEQSGWLSLLITEDVQAAEKLQQIYPWLREIYREMADYLNSPKEVLSMFSEALRIMDRNTVQYMIEEQQKEIENQKQDIESQLQKIMEQREEIESQQIEIKNQQAEIESQQTEIKNQQAEIERLRRLLREEGKQ